MNNTMALILAGGRGKRMGMFFDVRPKPALPFAGRFRVIDFSLSKSAAVVPSGVTVTPVVRLNKSMNIVMRGMK